MSEETKSLIVMACIIAGLAILVIAASFNW
jgi:hypothetical protein